MRTKLRCHCALGNDMTCPSELSLDELLDELRAAGYEPVTDELSAIDTRWARSPLASCTNCHAAGRFDSIGVRRGSSLRIFWLCRSCSHWLEV